MFVKENPCRVKPPALRWGRLSLLPSTNSSMVHTERMLVGTRQRPALEAMPCLPGRFARAGL